jgi:hypothetical protein
MSGRGMFWALMFSLPLWTMVAGVGLLIHLAF